jgi:hypothetical protein
MWTEQLLGRRRGLCLGLGLSGKVQSSRWSKQGTGARGVVLGWGSVESVSTRSSWHSSTTWSWRGGMKESCVIFWKHDARSTFWQIGGAVCFPRLRLSAALLGAGLLFGWYEDTSLLYSPADAASLPVKYRDVDSAYIHQCSLARILSQPTTASCFDWASVPAAPLNTCRCKCCWRWHCPFHIGTCRPCKDSPFLRMPEGSLLETALEKHEGET